MAYNKECLIVIVDIREGANKDFKEKSIKCVAEIFKDKICSGKKDFVSFALLGADNSRNSLNTTDTDGYLNIVEYPHIQFFTWQLLINFFRIVNDEEASETGEGDWLDALVVALNMHRLHAETSKCARRRIVLFHNFDGAPSDYDQFDVIAKSILEQSIELIVVSDRIGYVDDIENNVTYPIFKEPCQHPKAIQNEKCALDLRFACNAELCNFKEALKTIFKVTTKRPWCWYGKLRIGSKIIISISGSIAIKDESNIRLKKCWGNPDEVVSRELKTFIHGTEVKPSEDDLITGYMLGGTPIAFDETIQDDKETWETGLTFLGFTKINDIPEEYFCGESLYWIVHQKGKTASAKKLDALVRAMIKSEGAMLCWKIYSAKYNNPKLVALLPNAMQDNRPATLSMIELTYYAQQYFWDFPTLRTEKTKPSAEQLAAIDNLIDSMDLNVETTKSARETRSSEVLPFDGLPHIFEQNVMDVLERKIISNAGEDDEEFQQMLADKNFVEVFWTVPEDIEEQAKQAAQKVKHLFPLEVTALPKARTKTTASSDDTNAANVDGERNNNDLDAFGGSQGISFTVGYETPAADFEKLLKLLVIPIKDHTARDKKFHSIASQMRSAIWHLIFETDDEFDQHKVVEALKTYRKRSIEFNAFSDYNIWIREVKNFIIERKMFDFWRDVIVKEDLGLYFVGAITLEEKIKLDEFNRIDEDD